MLKRILNGQSSTITSAAIIIAGASFVSRLVGLVRDRILAHYFGAGPIMDAYYASFKIPDLVYNLLIAGALTAGFIPTFTKLFDLGEDKNPAWDLASNIINILGIGLIFLCGLGIIFAAPLAVIIAPGFAPASQALVVSLTRIMFLSPLLLGFSMVLGGILQSLRRFVLYAIAPIFYNLGIIAGAVGLYPIFGPQGLAWGVILGALLHLTLQIYGAYDAGYRWHWRFNFKDKATRLVGKLMIPRTLGLAMTNINAVIVTMLASLLPVGSVAVYNYANNLQWFPIGLIGIPFALAAFPILSAAAAKNDEPNFVKTLSATAGQIIFLIIPASVLIMLLRAQIVRVVLGTGQFDWAATINTADALAFFALGLFAQALIPLLARAFYALADTKTPFVISLISELISIITALLLMDSLGVSGLALASSVGAILNFVLLTIYLRQTTGSLDEAVILPTLYKIALATLVMGLSIQWLKYPLAKIFDQHYLWGILGQGLSAGLVGLFIYIALCHLLKVPEYLHFRQSFQRRWLKFINVATTESFETKE